MGRNLHGGGCWGNLNNVLFGTVTMTFNKYNKNGKNKIDFF
jgi:hypothetical protein